MLSNHLKFICTFLKSNFSSSDNVFLSRSAEKKKVIKKIHIKYQINFL